MPLPAGQLGQLDTSILVQRIIASIDFPCLSQTEIRRRTQQAALPLVDCHMSCTTEPTSDDARNIAPSTPVSAVDALLSSTSVRMPVGQLDRAFATKLSTRRHQYKVLFLKHLDLSGCKYITDAGLRVVSTMKRLVRLNLEGCSIAGSSLIDFPKLTRLSLRGCINITDATNLGLHGLRSATDEELNSISTLSQLEYLDLSGCRKITGCSLYYMPTLTHLNLSGCANVTDEGLRGISSLAALQRLDLSRCKLITGSSICNLPALLHLILQHCMRVTDEDIWGLSSLSELRELNLRDCNQITGCWLSAVSTLTHLDLTFCNNVNNTGLLSISKLSQLQHLDLRGCTGFDEVGLRRIATLPKLSHLTLPKRNILGAVKFRNNVNIVQD